MYTTRSLFSGIHTITVATETDKSNVEISHMMNPRRILFKRTARVNGRREGYLRIGGEMDVASRRIFVINFED